MRVPVSWLRDYVTFDLPLRELGERMSMTGTKLEALHHRGVPAHVELYRVGRVLTRAQHPNADRLSLCTVDVGDGEPRQIVCGASNFEAGATVAVALPGAVLPDGTELRVAKLRGSESHGMMLSERELELGQDHAGIMLLPDDWPVGDALIEHLAIADDVLEFEITSNRPDCQNVYGIAREVSAVLDTDLAPWPGTEPEATGHGTASDHVRARIDAPEMCPRWAARVFTDVRVGPSPPWLKARIAAAGMRPISNVVDITNYVMLAVGEPTHAFDLDRVAGREIIVRRATAGEPVTTLDGQQRVLDTETLVIADAERPSAIAGLMGSEWSEVTDETTTVLMECANFDGPSIQSLLDPARPAHRGVEPVGEGPRSAPPADRAAAGLAADGRAGRCPAGAGHDRPARRPARAAGRAAAQAPARGDDRGRLHRRRDRPGAHPARLRAHRRRLARADMARRRHDPRDRPDRGGRAGVRPRAGAVRDARRCAHGRPAERRGAAAADGGRCAARRRPVGGGDADALGQGRPRPAATRARRPPARAGRAPEPDERGVGGDAHARVPRAPALRPPQPGDVAAPRRPVRDRPRLPARRRQAARPAGAGGGRCWPAPGRGFFDAKGVVETLVAAARIDPPEFSPADEPFLHPGRAAAVADGFVGELHPLVAEAFGLEGVVAVFELGLDGLRGRPPEQVLYRDVISFPPLRQDIAVVVAEDVPAGGVVGGGARGGGRRARGRRGVRRLPRAAGGGGAQEPRAAPGVPGRRPHAHRRRGRRPARAGRGRALRAGRGRAAGVRSERLVELLDGYFGTLDVRGDDWSDLFELVYPDPYWREFAEPGYEGRWNGLLVRGGDEVTRVATCVFPSDRVVGLLAPGTFLFSEHPIDYGDEPGFLPLARETFERMRAGGIGFYHVHAPIDHHPRCPRRGCARRPWACRWRRSTCRSPRASPAARR